MSAERLWFGVEGSHRRLLEEKSEHAYAALFEDCASIDRLSRSITGTRFIAAPARTGWNRLRRDITQLDPGLIIAPLHAQFRTARGGRLGVRPIDMLAPRQDGRLVVIELKVSEDREHVLQGADYWQRVEAHRRRVTLRVRNSLANERSAMSLRWSILSRRPSRAPSLQTLARAISSDIEIYRFDINEDWRSGVRVMRRMRLI